MRVDRRSEDGRTVNDVVIDPANHTFAVYVELRAVDGKAVEFVEENRSVGADAHGEFTAPHHRRKGYLAR